MTLKDRRAREKKAREKLILDVAERMFLEKGIDSVSMRDIAWETELSKGTLYLYFKDKDDLTHGVISRGLEKMLSSFQQAQKKGKTGMQKVFNIGMAFLEFHNQNSILAKLIMDEEINEHKHRHLDEFLWIKKCDVLSNEIFALLVECIETGKKDQSMVLNETLESITVALILWGMVSGVMQIKKSKGEFFKEKFNIEPDKMVFGVLDLLKKAFQNK